MINQPEERPLSIGSAVQFTHKGKTIHGHLLQRQGRRRFAKIVDTEERTWKVPESALKHSGGARRVTIITRHDKARAAYRVGDEVTFTSPDGPRRGSIVKLNPKSAQVRCGKTCWNVSYGLLRRAGRESARNGAERLNGVAGMARRLMDERGGVPGRPISRRHIPDLVRPDGRQCRAPVPPRQRRARREPSGPEQLSDVDLGLGLGKDLRTKDVN